MVTTNSDGGWKSVQGTLTEVLNQLNTDNVKRDDVIGFSYDSGASNFVVVYWDNF